MHIIAFIEDPDVMKKILKHLGLWDVKRKPRPVANAPPIDVFPAYDEQPGPSSDDYIRGPDYDLHSEYGTLLDGAGWGLVPHQQRPNMLLPIPRRHTTLSTLIYCLIRSQKANSYPLRCHVAPKGQCFMKKTLHLEPVKCAVKLQIPHLAVTKI
jgi:hypothetical protein